MEVQLTSSVCILIPRGEKREKSFGESVPRTKNNREIDSVLFRVQASDNNAPGMTCSASNHLKRILSTAVVSL